VPWFHLYKFSPLSSPRHHRRRLAAEEEGQDELVEGDGEADQEAGEGNPAAQGAYRDRSTGTVSPPVTQVVRQLDGFCVD